METDYKKLYENALSRAKKWYNDPHITIGLKGNLKDIFPELKESEDERIRSALLRGFNSMYGNQAVTTFAGEPIKNILSWLEKQGQEKSVDMSIKEKAHQIAWELSKHYDPNACKQEWCEMAAIDMASWLEKQGDTNETINRDEFAQGILRGAAIHLMTWIDYNAAEGNMCLSNMECKDIEDALVGGNWDKIYTYIKKKLEKQREQKPTDKVEPKFKVGDWVIGRVTGNEPRQIAEITEKGYKTTYGGWIGFSFEEDICLWTIQGAKEWDVLVQLFRKMKEAGYEWDTEKKELKKINNALEECEIENIEHGKYYYCIKDYFCGGRKQASKGDVVQALRGMAMMSLGDKAGNYFLPINYIEQKPTDSYCQENCKGFQETGRCFADGECKAKREAEQKPTWSKEDEDAIGMAIEALEDLCDVDDPSTSFIGHNLSFAEATERLRALKPQLHWKPTEEQMTALKIVKKGFPADDLDAIESLYNELKKLRL